MQTLGVCGATRQWGEHSDASGEWIPAGPEGDLAPGSIQAGQGLWRVAQQMGALAPFLTEELWDEEEQPPTPQVVIPHIHFHTGICA